MKKNKIISLSEAWVKWHIYPYPHDKYWRIKYRLIKEGKYEIK